MIENLMRAVPDTSLFAIFRHDPVTSCSLVPLSSHYILVIFFFGPYLLIH